MTTQTNPTQTADAEALQAAVSHIVTLAFEPGASLFGSALSLDNRRALAEAGVDCLLAMLSRASLPLPTQEQLLEELRELAKITHQERKFYPRFIRPPYSRTEQCCVCAATDKDACTCHSQLRPIFLTGPQGCGKTTKAPLIAAALGCTSVIDDPVDAIESPGLRPLYLVEELPVYPKGSVLIKVFDSEGLDTLLAALSPSAA